MASGARIEVVAGVVESDDGCVLLAQRPADREHGGLWEFPGGKLEPGEDARTALARELREELGLDLTEATPLIAVCCDLGRRPIRLHALRARCHGAPQPHDGQRFAWVERDALRTYTMPPADRPIAAALLDAPFYPITPEPGDDNPASDARWLHRVERWIEAGHRRIQLRVKRDAARRSRLVRAACERAHGADVELMVNADIALARELHIGVHLTSAQLVDLDDRPLPVGQLVAASCHDASELHRALALDADVAVLSPVQRTASHPEAAPLGWTRFAELRACSPLPVYALGGLGTDDLDIARAHGAQGIAGISAFTRDVID